MARGPQGQKRPADVIGAAIMAAKIATGELFGEPKLKSGRTRGGQAGGKAHATWLSPKTRTEQI